jgi:hypothetical protein
MPLNEKVSFSFATYTGRTGGGSTVAWNCFWGTYTLTMNERMANLIIEAIDEGSEEDGELEPEVYDFVEMLDKIADADKPVAYRQNYACNELFSVVKFNNTITVQARYKGLEILKRAINTGAQASNLYERSDGGALFALVGQIDKLLKAEQTRRAERDSSDFERRSA